MALKALNIFIIGERLPEEGLDDFVVVFGRSPAGGATHDREYAAVRAGPCASASWDSQAAKKRLAVPAEERGTLHTTQFARQVLPFSARRISPRCQRHFFSSRLCS